MALPGSLLVDLGNTSLKWAFYDANARAPGQASRVQHRGEDLYGLLDRHWGPLPVPAKVVVGSVAKAAAQSRLRAWVEDSWRQEAVQVRSQARACGVVNAYRNPEKLGVDRWLALIAVHRRTRAPACIVDCGTAVTFDGLDPEGRHLGGLILPGLRMMQDALLGHTQIGLLSPVDGVELLARDTAGAVTSGALFACAGLLELVVGRIARECGRVPEVVLTGGDGAKLQAVLETGSGYEPDLVLQGLAELAGDDGA